MYKLPQEIKKLIIVSSIVSLVICLVLVFFNPFYVLFYLAGFIASVANMFIKNYVATSVVYKMANNPKSTAVWLNILGNLLYFAFLLVGFLFGIVEGFIVAAGEILMKFILIILYGFK